jgi:hypothetical protein
MGNNLFGANISGKLNKALGKRLPVVTITHFTPGTRTAATPSAGANPTETTHTGRGVRLGMSSLRKGTIHPETKDAVLVLGDSISPSVVPAANDTITINGVENTIVITEVDPDNAAFICQVK